MNFGKYLAKLVPRKIYKPITESKRIDDVGKLSARHRTLADTINIQTLTGQDWMGDKGVFVARRDGDEIFPTDDNNKFIWQKRYFGEEKGEQIYSPNVDLMALVGKNGLLIPEFMGETPLGYKIGRFEKHTLELALEELVNISARDARKTINENRKIESFTRNSGLGIGINDLLEFKLSLGNLSAHYKFDENGHITTTLKEFEVRITSFPKAERNNVLTMIPTIQQGILISETIRNGSPKGVYSPNYLALRFPINLGFSFKASSGDIRFGYIDLSSGEVFTNPPHEHTFSICAITNKKDIRDI